MSEQCVLYQYDTCPFCRRVRAFLEEIGLDIPLRDTMRETSAYRELLTGGGLGAVPCLKITAHSGEVRWLYESEDIIDYLRRCR